MVKYDETSYSFKYYDENGEHRLIDKITYEEAAKIICDLKLSTDFMCDMTISHALYVAMRKLQGFSDDFVIDVSNAQAYKQFGNAVTVNVSRAVATKIREKLEEIGEWH